MRIMKKYYHTLCHSLSPNRFKNLSIITGPPSPANSILHSQLEQCQSSLEANKVLMDILIMSLDCEERLVDVCDMLDRMIEGELKHNLEMFRNGKVMTYVLLYNLCTVFTEILAELSNKPEGSIDPRTNTTTTAITYLKVLSPEGVQHLVVSGSMVPDSRQQDMYATATTDGTTAKAIMSATHSPLHSHHSHDVELGK